MTTNRTRTLADVTKALRQSKLGTCPTCGAKAYVNQRTGQVYCHHRRGVAKV